ncbi:MAG TPA: TonB-dependent receptor [Polyangia bacterium]|nr:TonB-dependent receptor [Polyangia bacterium]
MSRRFAAAAALLGLLAPATVHAQQGSQPAPAPVPAEDQELLAQPASTYLITDTSQSGPGTPGQRFDPDTEVRLTATELRERGVTNLGQALLLIPELSERPSGRGEVRVDIRGARKSDVMVLIDGVAINEPFYGVFDLSSIPVTDIAEIRIALAPASPLDGPGGAGGVVEVVTTAATGARRVQARVEGSDAPGALAAVTGRAEALRGLAIRVSGGGSASARDFQVVMADGSQRALGEDARALQAALRLEHAGAGGAIFVDGWLEHRSFLSPPGEDGTLQVMHIDGETAANGALGGHLKLGGWRLEGRGYVQRLDRDLTRFSDATLGMLAGQEKISSDREGMLLRANRFLGPAFELALTANADSEHATDSDGLGNVGGGRSAIAELASGLLWTPTARLRVQTSAGFFVPIDDPSSPWPEGKLVLSLVPVRWLEVRLTGARKGRTPTIRERYQIGVGNPNLRPEMSSFGEIELAYRPRPWVLVRGAGYVRATDDLIRFNDARTLQINYGDVVVRGLEASLEIGRGRALGGGGSYQFADQGDPAPGQTSVGLENFPQHKADLWLEARLGTRGGLWSRWRYVGDRTDQGMPLHAYSELDLSVWGRLLRDVRAALRVDNLTGERYLVRSTQYALGRTFIFSLDGVWE